MNETIKIGVLLYKGENLPIIKHPGFYLESNRLICEASRNPCCFQPFYGPASNRTQGILRALQQGVFNMTEPDYMVTLDRHEVLTLPSYHFTEELDGIFVTRRPKQRSYHLSSFLDPFSMEVWICIVFSALLVSFTLEIHDSKHRDSCQIQTVLQKFLDLLVFLARKGPKISVSHIFAKILLTIWGCIAMIFIIGYSSAVLSALLKFDRAVPFKTFDSLILCIEERRCSFIFFKDAVSVFTRIKSQSPTHFQRFYDAVNREKILIETLENAIDIILSHEDKFYVTGVLSGTELALLPKYKCDLLLIKTKLVIPTTALLRKGDKMVEKLNRVLFSLDEFGLFKGLQRFYPVNPTCDWFNLQSDVVKGLPLPMDSLHGPLLLVLTGTIGGFVCLFFELHSKYSCQRLKSRFSRNCAYTASNIFDQRLST